MKFDAVADHKVILVPVENARQCCLLGELFECDAYTDGAKAYCFSGIAYSQHRYSFVSDETSLTKRLQCVGLAIIFGNHAQTRRTAIHGVELGVIWKAHFQFVS